MGAAASAEAREQGMQLLALESTGTQYMWTTWRKPLPTAEGVTAAEPGLRRITNALTAEPLVPVSGRLGCIALWIVNLPPESDLNTIDVRVDGRSGVLTFVGPPETDNLQQVNVRLPDGTRTGLVPVEIFVNGERLCPPATARVIPAGPLVPRIDSITDGINLIEENRSTTGSLKVQIEEVLHPELITATVANGPARD